VEEFYTRPILSVRDVGASIRYYCEKLGFAPVWAFPEDAAILAQVGRKGLELILDAGSAIPRAATPSVVSMSLHEPRQLGELYRELQHRGARIAAAPFEVVWEKGLYELDVEDLDGNVLVFWGEKPEAESMP
jgi:catechol 2,3-dioxygenase-like lactoylglutathione lyase family enzyme